MANLLELDGVQTTYGFSQVLHGISLAIAPGEVVTLMGRNGMGKTTTVRSIMGLTRAMAGSIRFGGREIRTLPAYQVAKLGIGLVPEGRQVFPNLTARENLVATAANRAGAAEPWTLAKVCELFPRLSERLGATANLLSGGEQQMLVIGRALMTNPRLLILDEATEGLAPLIAQEIWRIVRTIRETGIAAIIVDKNFAAVSALTDRNVILVKGQVIFTGSGSELKSKPEFLQQHLGV
jgi:branched-chain amino acid transport system ATP-binding protein